jgi:hypothetical protein
VICGSKCVVETGPPLGGLVRLWIRFGRSEKLDMQTPDAIEAIRASIRHWRLADLASFAERRHGFGNTDGGFGVTYPGNLDEDDHVVVGIVIPIDCVRVHGFWGPPDGYELDVPEPLYLDTLAVELESAGLTADAQRVRALLPA